MFEVLVILILGFLYVVPIKGILKLSENEENFMKAYDGFTVMVPVDETNSEDLVGGTLGGFNQDENVPTMMEFNQENTENSNNENVTDINIDELM